MSIAVSIIIKALNEQKNIERTLISALKAANAINGEVILADSGSTDATVDIAKKFPIKIVQLANPSEKSCGIGAQLGYQYAKGDYVYILDGDMEIEIEFLQKALDLMASNKLLGGVGGLVREMQLEGLEFQSRVQRMDPDMQAGAVSHLAMGGLYRKKAIDQIGYLTNRNLHSYEEFELGIRLRAAGWSLLRLPTTAVKHYGHTMPAHKLLFRRWASGYVQGVGELLRSSIGKPHMRILLRELRELRLYGAVTVWWLLILISFFLISPWQGMIIAFLLFVIPFVVMIFKKRSFELGTYAVIAWFFFTAGMFKGLVRSQKNTSDSIVSVELT